MNTNATNEQNYSTVAAAVFWFFIFIIMNIAFETLDINGFIVNALSDTFFQNSLGNNLYLSVSIMTFLFTAYFSIIGFLNAKDMLKNKP